MSDYTPLPIADVVSWSITCAYCGWGGQSGGDPLPIALIVASHMARAHDDSTAAQRRVVRDTLALKANLARN